MNTFYSGGFSSRAKYPGGVTNAEQLKKENSRGLQGPTDEGARTPCHAEGVRVTHYTQHPLVWAPRGSTIIQYVATVYNVKGPCTSATLVNRTSSGSFARKDPRGSSMSSIV